MKTQQNNVVHLKPAAPDSGLSARIRFESDSRWLKYTGPHEDLISEGLATPDMFPTGRKRVKRDGESEYSSNWEVWKRTGNLFELRLPAPEPTEAAWDPERWKSNLCWVVNSSLGWIWQEANSARETDQYGVATHQLVDRDWYKLQALFEEVVEVIWEARVERATVPHLERVK